MRRRFGLGFRLRFGLADRVLEGGLKDHDVGQLGNPQLLAGRGAPKGVEEEVTAGREGVRGAGIPSVHG